MPPIGCRIRPSASPTLFCFRISASPEPPPILDRKPHRRRQHFLRHHPAQTPRFPPQLSSATNSIIFPATSNAIFTTGEEFNGPCHLRAIFLARHHRRLGNRNLPQHPTIALCCTKDVQDAILADPVRSKIVNVIDMKILAVHRKVALTAAEGSLRSHPAANMSPPANNPTCLESAAPKSRRPTPASPRLPPLTSPIRPSCSVTKM